MMNLKKILLLLFICGVFGDEVKEVMEGESVTLNSDLTETHTYRRILWRFGSDLIAQISEDKISYEDGPDGSFRDRLHLNNETASLTITNMKMKHSGLYKLEAISSSGTTYKRFSVSVYESPSAVTVVEAEMKSVSVTAGESLTLQTDVLQQRDELIVWRFGDEGKLIAKADLEAKKNSLQEDIDERFRDRLKLNKTGSLTINNMRITDSGLYIVKISSSKQTLHKRFSVTVSDSGWSSGAVAGIVVVVLLAVFAVAAVGFLYYRWKKGDVMKVTKTEGDFVTLPTGVTKLHTDDKVQWWYEDNLIAQITGGKEQTHDVDDERFSGKLTLDEDTGNLNISNIKTIHSGLYKLKITRKRWIISIPIPTHKRFILTVNLNTEQKNVGESVTLSIPTEFKLEEDDLILWKFGPTGSAIAKFDRETKKITTYDVSDKRFTDGLKLDEKTGSLTITNIKPEHAGVYQLQVSNRKKTTNRKYRVTIPENGASESATVEMWLLSEDQQGSV